MKYTRMPIEAESPEQFGYEKIKHNLAESSVTDAVLKNLPLNLSDLVLCYGHHVGHEGFRALLAKEYGLRSDDILLTAGAASALFIIATSLLEKEDHLVVVKPNYATNIETPKAIGCDISYINLQFENAFEIDLIELENAIKNNTKYVSITTPHNPTGVLISEEKLKKIIAICENKGIFLLVDETYRDMNYGKKLPLAATYSENVISVTSLSKTYGLPGIRIGWIVTKNKKLQDLFLAAKEQIFICNSVVDEEIAFQYYLKKDEFYPEIQTHIKDNFQIVKEFIQNQNYLEWVEPSGGVVCFPRFKLDIKIDIEKFYQILNNEYHTWVGPGHWFEMDKSYMRIGYGWSDSEQLKKGLENIIKSIGKSI
jgi:aspartate/methionine/tyrosine aminotransferase